MIEKIDIQYLLTFLEEPRTTMSGIAHRKTRTGR